MIKDHVFNKIVLILIFLQTQEIVLTVSHTVEHAQVHNFNVHLASKKNT